MARVECLRLFSSSRRVSGRERDKIGYQQFQIVPYGDHFPDLASFLNSLPHSRAFNPSPMVLSSQMHSNPFWGWLVTAYAHIAAISIPQVAQAHSHKAKRFALYHWWGLPSPLFEQLPILIVALPTVHGRTTPLRFSASSRSRPRIQLMSCDLAQRLKRPFTHDPTPHVSFSCALYSLQRSLHEQLAANHGSAACIRPLAALLKLHHLV